MVRQRVNGVEGGTGGSEESNNVVVLDATSVIDDSGASDDTGIPTVEPSEIIIEAEPDRSPKRGRPRGSKSTSTKQSTKEVSQDLTGLLLSVHFMLSKIVKVEELQLDEDEAKKLGEAVARVNKEFGVQIMSPKTAALVNLGIVGAGIYGPRAMAIVNNAKKKKEQAAQSVTGVIQ
jgi:hypothetical protein